MRRNRGVQLQCRIAGGMPPSDASIGPRWKEDQLIRRSTFDFEWNEERERERRMLAPKFSPRKRKSLCEMGETWDEGKGRLLFALSLLARRRRHRTRRGWRSPLPPLPPRTRSFLPSLIPTFDPVARQLSSPAHRGPSMPNLFSLERYDRNVEPHHDMSILQPKVVRF